MTESDFSNGGKSRWLRWRGGLVLLIVLGAMGGVIHFTKAGEKINSDFQNELINGLFRGTRYELKKFVNIFGVSCIIFSFGLRTI